VDDNVEITPSTAGQRRYDRTLRRRLRVADAAAWMRAGGIQAVWLVVLVAGAAVPLTEAVIADGWTWVSPVLGFVIVVAAGLERIFQRTTGAAAALDDLRRKVARERRMVQAGAGVYADADASYAQYAARIEEHIADYDRQMVEYARRVVGDA
jgi:protein-S-isoprenylcysteine O-methyltransferase Ste14